MKKEEVRDAIYRLYLINVGCILYLEYIGEKLIRSSGSSIVEDKAAGECSSVVYHEETIDALSEKKARFSIVGMK